MTLKTLARLCGVCVIVAMALPAPAGEDIAQNKRTQVGLYITAEEAYERWRAEPEAVRILDVRTPAEYFFVGHAQMAYNVPLKFMDTATNVTKNKPVMQPNQSFVDEVKSRFGTDDTIMIMCRSGVRSAAAVDKLTAVGFKNVYTVVDGFEGDALKAPGSYNDGKRLLNGWKNSGAPWGYALDPALVYRPVSE